MTTRRQANNLRRGGVTGNAETAAKARAAKAEYRRADEDLAATASADPWRAYQDLHATMTRHISKLLRDEERSGGKPARDVTDRLREYRVTTQALSEYRGSRGHLEEARDFFETLGERIGQINSLTRCPNCGESVEVVKPIVDV